MKTEILTQADLTILKATFPRESLGVKVQSISKDKSRAMLVLYLQHTHVQDRLEQVDPAWSTEVLREERTGDTVYVRIRMTVKGVTRENVGEGSDPKGAYSDALKRCAMLFGVGRYLYDSPTVWADYSEQRDRFRHWTMDDYERALNGSSSSKPSRTSVTPKPKAASAGGAKEQNSSGDPGLTTSARGGSPSPAPASPTEAVTQAKEPTPREKRSSRTRDQLNRILLSLYRPYLTRFPKTRFMDLLRSRYGVPETRMMTQEQIEDLVQYMEQQLANAA